MEKVEMQARAQKASATIGAAMVMIFFGKTDQAVELLKEATKELNQISGADGWSPVKTEAS